MIEHAKDYLLAAAVEFVRARTGPTVNGETLMNFPTARGVAAWRVLVVAVQAYETASAAAGADEYEQQDAPPKRGACRPRTDPKPMAYPDHIT